MCFCESSIAQCLERSQCILKSSRERIQNLAHTETETEENKPIYMTVQGDFCYCSET